jgi:hypothetical protein
VFRSCHVFGCVNLISVFCRTRSDIRETACQRIVHHRTAAYNAELNAMYVTRCRMSKYRANRLKSHFGNYFRHFYSLLVLHFKIISVGRFCSILSNKFYYLMLYCKGSCIAAGKYTLIHMLLFWYVLRSCCCCLLSSSNLRLIKKNKPFHFPADIFIT